MRIRNGFRFSMVLVVSGFLTLAGISRSEAVSFTSLGDLAGGSFFSYANDVSGDGSVVVGRGRSVSGFEAFVWDSANGMQSISSVLTGSGVDMTGWSLTEARGISNDGMTIVGMGTNPSGFTEAWVADLNGATFSEPIPEPATIALLGIGLAGPG